MSNRLRARMANALRHRLHYASAKHPLAEIIPDANWPGMWRVRWPDGSLSHLTNLSRARDAAIAIAERGPPARNRRLLSWRTEYVEEALGPSPVSQKTTAHPGGHGEGASSPVTRNAGKKLNVTLK